MEHAPVLLHLCQVLDIVCQILLRLRFQLWVLREHAMNMDGRREEGRVACKWCDDVVIHGFVN